ncbi:MAG TPA: hypothetical protein VN952_12360 [Chthoniobacterales bacterium]|nr:hypothetical protein [Chthoniobacterales bacterium]
MDWSAKLSSNRAALGGSEKTDQFGEAPLVGVADGRFAIGLDPFWMLNTQVIVYLLLEFAVRANLARKGNWVGKS